MAPIYGDQKIAQFSQEDLDFIKTLPWTSEVAFDDVRMGLSDGVALQQRLETWQEGHRFTQSEMQLIANTARIARLDYEQEVLDLAIRARVLAKRSAVPSGPDDKWVSMFMARYVSSIGPGRTLQEVGDLFGCTRERVRQICKCLIDQLKGKAFAPTTMNVLAAANRYGPAQASEVSDQLRTMLGSNAGIHAALEFAKDLGMPDVKVSLEATNRYIGRTRLDVRSLHSADDGQLVKAVLNAALPMIRDMGCTTLLRVAGTLALDAQMAPGREQLIAMLQCVPGFVWLGEPGNWFSAGDHGASSNVARRVRKLLATVDDTVNIETVLHALVDDNMRPYRSNLPDIGYPPSIILGEMLQKWDWIECIQYTRFKAKQGSLPDDVLTDCESMLVQTLRSLGGVSTRKELSDVVESQYSLSSVRTSQMLSSAPFLVRIEQSIYGIRAARISGKALDEARQRLHIERGVGNAATVLSVQEKQWDLLVTRASLTNEQYGVPAFFKGILPPGLYTIQNHGGSFRIGVHHIIRGLNRHFPGVAHGDLLRISVLEAGKVSVEQVKSDSHSDV